MLLAKKYGDDESSLKEHLEKNLWAAQILTTHNQAKNKIEKINPIIIKSVILSSVFHDLGKVNKAFQEKLMNSSVKKELLTHDAISFMFLIELYFKNKDKKELLLAAYAALKHHNRTFFIENLPSTASGIKKTIDACFSDIKIYHEEQKNKVSIDDSQWIKRSHKNGMGEVSKLNLDISVIKIYEELGFEEYSLDLSVFIEKVNNESKNTSVERFIKYLGYLIREGETQKEAENYYCQLLLTKNLFKICDEYASQSGTSNIESEYKKEFLDVINNMFFFEKNVSPLAIDILKGELEAKPAQKEIIDAKTLADCIILKSNTGAGKTVSAELIKYKKNLNFISYHTPTRFLALEQATRIFDSLDSLLEAKKIRYIKEMGIYHHTIDQIYLSLVGYKREYLLLKHFFNGIVVLDEIDLFQDRSSFFNIAFMLKVLSELKVPVIITTATSTKTLEDLVKSNYSGTFEIFPKAESLNSKVRSDIHLFKNESGNDYLKQISDEIVNQQKNGKKVGIFFNNTSSCALFASDLKKRKVDFILYHARLSKDVKDKNKEKLLSNFKKNSEIKKTYPIAIMSPLAEVGVDISFNIMFSDPSPIRNIEQRAGRLNRWGLDSGCILFILDDFICGFGSKKNWSEVKSKKINNQEIFSFDPYFTDKLKPLNQHNRAYQELDKVQMGFEQNFINPAIQLKFNDYKDTWFKGILNNERVGILDKYNTNTPNYTLDYKYSLALLPYIFIKKAQEDFINMCFRQVAAIEFITEDRVYSSVPNYFFTNGKLKKDFIEDEEFGIVKAWAIQK